ncbi:MULTISPECIES: META domain-containing protein [Paracoccus]|uniref:META domain-containing protein n=1 Tax=Paracoccus litorisediminis TaxID=2006130 RepID=A0A844HGJ3_9RHOB|nr:MULTISPECIES: META domain-containing protein [Paracoccus]MBD9525529.1 META domain-containing protein [Paracoccus sp. PAR01]MTH57979.1 META domain-containing protein [Paracoccus litorisediminis]
MLRRLALVLACGCLALAMVGTFLVAARAETREVTGDYELIEIEGKTITGTATARLAPDGAISGQGPCNRYTGPNRATLPELLYENLATTRRACLVEGGEAEFLAALGAVRHAKFVGEDLVMTGPEVTIRWRPVAKTAP